MSKHIVTALFVIVGLINFAPLMGVIGGERLSSMYGVSITSPDLIVLMRHRAVLFGIVGAFIILAAFKPELRTAASLFGYISMISYVVLVLTDRAVNANLDRVMQIDVIAIILLTVAVVLGRSN